MNKKKFYTPSEVELHNRADDCWITIYDRYSSDSW